MYRGSRKHVLDWTGRSSFLDEFHELIGNLPVDLSGALVMPRGISAPQEARLEQFGPTWLPGNPAWEHLCNWWLCHQRGANTPNCDIAAGCFIEGRPGLVLVEAKANWPELSASGKNRAKPESDRSRENHDRIGAAINEARIGWCEHYPGVEISRDSHYQLSNRLAFAWKLAMLGIPTVLMYLGFTGDKGISDAGQYFQDDSDWKEAFRQYSNERVPEAVLEQRLEFGTAPVWLLVRSRPALEQSPPPPKK